MGVTADSTNVAYIYKRRYSDRQATEVAMREHPTLYGIAKEMGFDGIGFFYGITYANPQGISSLFATAQTNSEVLQGVQLQMSRKLKYGVIDLDGPSMAAARGNKGSMYDLVTRTTDGILEELGANIAFDLQRDGNGIRGRRLSASTNVITLTDKRDVENFRKGMTVGASPNADGSSPRVGVTKIASISRSASTITLVSAAAIASFANNDYLFREGDPGNCMEGFEKCTPLTAPVGGDSFRGIDRSLDVEALAGSRQSDTTKFPEEAAGDCAVDISIIGKKVSRGGVYPTVFQQIVKRRDAKVMYDNPGETADIGFEYINLVTAGGTVKLYSDPDVAYDRVRLYRPDAHCLKTLDEMVHIIRDDGRPSLRATASDGIQIRARFMGNYLQYDTASHGVVAVAP